MVLSATSDQCSAVTHAGVRCASAATDAASGKCAHHARMARVMALAPKSAPSPPSSVSSASASTSASISAAPASGYSDLFGGASSPASSISSASSSSFAMASLSNSLSNSTASYSGNATDLLPNETVTATLSCSFVFPSALRLPDLPGALVLTSFRLRFEPQSSSLRTRGAFHRLLDAALRGQPRASVARIAYPQATTPASRSHGGGMPSQLVLKFKDLRSWTLGGDVTRLLPTLNRHVFLDSPLSLFAFSAGATPQDRQAHVLYDLQADFRRMGVTLAGSNGYFRVTQLNANFAMCPTYPRELVVPAAASDAEVGAVAAFRSKGRLPICSFVHARNGAALWRCAQPKRGILHAQSTADEQYLLHIARATSAAGGRQIWIADCRPELNARANNLTGGGTESGNLAHARLSFLNIGNIHTMRESLEAVRALGSGNGIGNYSESADLGWGARVEDTRWLAHVRRVLAGALQVARALEEQATTVVVHCSDGWDRTAQLCALAQLLLDAHYRSRRGFLELLEKEWLRAGHKFQDRVAPGRTEADDDQQAPIFLQFLDCVWQLTRVFPTHFEFNARLLEALADALFSARYGSFLGNCERERSAWHVRERTPSLWVPLLRDSRFVNPFFRPDGERALLPDAPAVLRQVTLWSSYYFRGAVFPAAPGCSPTPPLFAAGEQDEDDVTSFNGPQEDLEMAMAAALRRISVLEDELRDAKAGGSTLKAVEYPSLFGTEPSRGGAPVAAATAVAPPPAPASNGSNGSNGSFSASGNGYQASRSVSNGSCSGSGSAGPAAMASKQVSASVATWTCAVCSKANSADTFQCVVCGRTPR